MYFLCEKLNKTIKILKNLLKLISFSMSKLMVFYFQLFKTPLLNIGHEKIFLNM